jgi:hypothetical protein
MLSGCTAHVGDLAYILYLRLWKFPPPPMGWDRVHLVLWPLFGQLYQPHMIDDDDDGDDCGVIGEWKLAGETEVLGENLTQWHFAHHKSHMTWTRLGSGPPRWETGDQPPELWHGQIWGLLFYLTSRLFNFNYTVWLVLCSLKDITSCVQTLFILRELNARF